MPTTSEDNKPTIDNIDAEILYQYGHAYTETDMDLWPNDKAVVLVETVDGQRIALCEFSTNQEALDLIFTYFRQSLTITYKPIVARRECFNMDSKEAEMEKELFLDLLLDII